MNSSNAAIMLTATLVVVGIAGFVGADIADDVADYTQSASDWCDDHDGELHNANVIGSHGGLHCELPNGTTVHMSDYVEVGSA